MIPKHRPRGPRVDKHVLTFAPPPVAERKPIGQRNGLNTYTRLAQRNPVRLARLQGRTDGPHVEWIRALPCCICFAPLYDVPLTPCLLDRSPDNPEQARISEPHHVRTRGAGGEQLCVPLCRDHHDQIDAPGWGHVTFCRTYGVDVDALAAMLWEVSPFAIDEEEVAG